MSTTHYSRLKEVVSWDVTIDKPIRATVSLIRRKDQVQASGLLFHLLISHTHSPCRSLHRVLLLQSPLIYVQIWTLDRRSYLFVIIPSTRRVTKSSVDYEECSRTWTNISKRSHHFAYSARYRFTSSTCSRVYVEASNVCSSPSGS